MNVLSVSKSIVMLVAVLGFALVIAPGCGKKKSGSNNQYADPYYNPYSNPYNTPYNNQYGPGPTGPYNPYYRPVDNRYWGPNYYDQGCGYAGVSAQYYQLYGFSACVSLQTVYSYYPTYTWGAPVYSCLAGSPGCATIGGTMGIRVGY